MAVFNYKKFKIALRSDSKKTQGLHVGDIVRRQYFDGTSTVYSLMCVLEIGKDGLDQSYFIGALLEGDEPRQNQILDFARITNLFDTGRSGALYLTASDSDAPYMDVIDGIGRNESLSWPSGLSFVDNQDPQTQYILENDALASSRYYPTLNDNSRVLCLTRNSASGTLVLKQDFYKYVTNPNRVVISYKIKASRPMTAVASLEYIDGVRVDGSVDVNVTDEWTYQLHAITVDWSGRHLRSVKISMPDLNNGDEVWVADLNIILLSSLAQFGDSSQIRIGKLDGVTDPVFGRLSGYGSYLQKLFSSGSAHISGTLTAGDENGFGSTFYAGKIHRNVFVNSIEPRFTNSLSADNLVVNPTGLGNVYRISESQTVIAQTASWYRERVGNKYCLSFWAFANNPCTISVLQNGFVVGTIQIYSGQTHKWERHSVSFDLLEPNSPLEALTFTFAPSFSDEESDSISADQAVIAADTQVVYDNSFYFSAPQLESGDMVSQYQATDAILNETEDYGAWFNRGGIGGTIQNPLLKLNFDGQGSIGTRTNSFLLRIDGSGYLANSNIRWDELGNVTFGKNVLLEWDNFAASAQKAFVGKNVQIVGNNTIVVVKGGNSGLDEYSPNSLVLNLNTTNFTLEEATYQWQYMSDSDWVDIDGATGTSLEVLPTSSMWDQDDSIVLRVCATVYGTTYFDTVVLRKMAVYGYTVEIVSESGVSFHNGRCQTTLTANLYYRGELVNDTDRKVVFKWHKYNLPDTENEDLTWFQEVIDDDGNVIREAIDITSKQIVLDYAISNQDYFVCTVSTTDMFVYDFPINL